MTDSTPNVCIIGAGPAGLAAARNLTLRNIQYTQFERHTGVGGIWDIDNPGTPMYNSAHFISSRSMAGYYGFPMPDHYPDYPGQRLILEYTNNFTDAYDLRRKITFSMGVKDVAKAGDGWKVTTENGQSQNFTHVICTSGHTWKPNMPTYAGEFTGETMHSVDYREASLFEGKRVLVVGAGNSACDIACDAAQSADAAFISMRRGYHFVPKHIFGVPADVFGARSHWMPFKVRRFFFERILKTLNGDLTQLGLQAPDHRVLASHPIINSQLIHYLQHGDVSACPDIARLDGKVVEFKDGRREEIDLIVFATGYDYAIPYVDSELMNWKNGKPHLAYTVFNERNPSLFAAGFTEMNGGGYYIFDEMTSLIADAIEMERDKPEAWKKAWEQVKQPTDFTGPLGLIGSQRHSDYVDMETFFAACSALRKKLGWRDVQKSLEAVQQVAPQVQAMAAE